MSIIRKTLIVSSCSLLNIAVAELFGKLTVKEVSLHREHKNFTQLSRVRLDRTRVLLVL